MSERDLTVTKNDRSADDWDRGTTTTRAVANDVARGGVSSWVGARIETALARLTQRFSRRPKDDDGEESTALVRTGGALARWISFPRGVRMATAASSTAAAGLAAWGMLAVAANDLGSAAAPRAHRRSARDPRSPFGRGARHRDRATDGGVGAGRTRRGLVADPISRRHLAVPQLLPRIRVRLPAGRRHRRTDLDRGGGRHADRAVPARRARAVPQYDAARARASV